MNIEKIEDNYDLLKKNLIELKSRIAQSTGEDYFKLCAQIHFLENLLIDHKEFRQSNKEHADNLQIKQVILKEV